MVGGGERVGPGRGGGDELVVEFEVFGDRHPPQPDVLLRGVLAGGGLGGWQILAGLPVELGIELGEAGAGGGERVGVAERGVELGLGDGDVMGGAVDVRQCLALDGLQVRQPVGAAAEQVLLHDLGGAEGHARVRHVDEFELNGGMTVDVAVEGGL